MSTNLLASAHIPRKDMFQTKVRDPILVKMNILHSFFLTIQFHSLTAVLVGNPRIRVILRTKSQFPPVLTLAHVLIFHANIIHP